MMSDFPFANAAPPVMDREIRLQLWLTERHAAPVIDETHVRRTCGLEESWGIKPEYGVLHTIITCVDLAAFVGSSMMPQDRNALMASYGWIRSIVREKDSWLRPVPLSAFDIRPRSTLPPEKKSWVDGFKPWIDQI
jgi:hypothetical protein